MRDRKWGYFKPHETECKCGCGLDIKDALRYEANILRHLYGSPLRVVSGARCKNYNERVGGAKNSYHTKGLAMDISMPTDSVERFRLLKHTFQPRFNGRGFYRTFVHLDIRQEENQPPAYWIGN